jgi:putative phosphoribosyl transferase
VRFLCRLEAGRTLARRLEHLRGERNLIVLALPRGGVPVAYEVARALGVRLEVLLTRRIEAPEAPARTLGAVAEGGATVLDGEAVRASRLDSASVRTLAETASDELLRDAATYRGERPLPLVEGRCVVVVDDGITTGASARAAVKALRARGARRVVLAVPVVAPEAAERVRGEVDELVYLQSPPEFIGVGYWYTRRGLSEEQAVSLLGRARRELGEAVSPHGWGAAVATAR